MQHYDLHYFPYPPLFLLAFLLLLGVLLVLLRWGVIRYVYARLGLSHRAAMLILFAALVGSSINIPLMYHLAQLIPGVGIALPPFLPSMATAVIAVVLDRRNAPRTAFVAGTLGTLIGADLLNLVHLRDLGAPVASIGGAGTFDGVFMIGIVAVLLAGFVGPANDGRTREETARGLPSS